MAFQDNAFPIEQGRVNITTGTVEGIVLCVTDGDLTVNWKTGSPSTVSCVAGNAYNLKNATNATVVAGGMFHHVG